MVHLSLLHLYRMIYLYGVYQIDITGAIMISTQKLSSLAYFYHDGIRNFDELTDNQKKNCLQTLPGLVEYFGYIFNFQTVLIGPTVYYKDYIEFITGHNILKYQQIESNTQANEIYYKIVPIKGYINQPSNQEILMKKCLGLIFLVFMYIKFTIVYEPLKNLDSEMISGPFWYRFFYMNISAMSQRIKYYLAWQITDLVCNASGLGFNGFEENGKAKWNLCTNVNILKLETSTSIKHFIDNWNVTTQKWLRIIAYERFPKGRTLASFVLSALWHGFYASYYCTFVSGACLVYAGRGIRQNIRPKFQKNDLSKLIYAIITWIGTIVSINYIALPFVLVGLRESFKFYNSWFWSIHILSILCIFLFPYNRTQGSNKEHKQVGTNQKN